jgi:hypothetical protein
MESETEPSPSYVYVLVRKDLPGPQIAVQAIHAAMEAARLWLPCGVGHPHLVLCAVSSEQRLLNAAEHLERNDVVFTLFREPDQRNEATALATQPLRDRRGVFRRYQCLREEDLSKSPVLEM